MTKKDCLLIKLITIFGWNVVRRYPPDSSGHWRAEKEDKFVIAFDIEGLFEKWLDEESVMETVLRIKVKRS